MGHPKSLRPRTRAPTQHYSGTHSYVVSLPGGELGTMLNS